jgi:hypothetical protein
MEILGADLLGSRAFVSLGCFVIGELIDYAENNELFNARKSQVN